jgi:hypothetical protein
MALFWHQTPFFNQLIEAIRAWVDARSATESRQILENYGDLLLTDAADEVLAGLIEHSEDENGIPLLEEYRTLLARCRYDGIDAAFADMVDLRKDTSTAGSDSLVEIVMAFVNAQTWAEKKRIVEAHHNVLLTDAAHEVLGNLRTEYQYSSYTVRQLIEHDLLLIRCRRAGIDAAFEDRLRPPNDAALRR